MVVIRERTSIDVSGTGWALVGRVPGTIAGALLLAAIPERALAILIAAVVIVGVALTSSGWIPLPHKRNLMLAGATSGVLGTATSIGGPPMALVWQGSTGPRLRGTMSGFFLIGSVMSIGMLSLTGAVDGHTFRAFGLLIPVSRRRIRTVAVRQPAAQSPAATVDGDRRVRCGRRRAHRATGRRAVTP